MVRWLLGSAFNSSTSTFSSRMLLSFLLTLLFRWLDLMALLIVIPEALWPSCTTTNPFSSHTRRRSLQKVSATKNLSTTEAISLTIQDLSIKMSCWQLPLRLAPGKTKPLSSERAINLKIWRVISQQSTAFQTSCVTSFVNKSGSILSKLGRQMLRKLSSFNSSRIKGRLCTIELINLHIRRTSSMTPLKMISIVHRCRIPGQTPITTVKITQRIWIQLARLEVKFCRLIFRVMQHP